jgi:choline dehydrogenase-like flavoprotein
VLLDAANVDQVPQTLNAHTTIVGAGAVGLFLGLLLARSAIKVIVLESGSQVAQSERRPAETVGKNHAGVKLGRAFGLGGTTNLWGGQLAEFEAEDLSLQGREWPISFQEMSTLYQQVYKFFQLPSLSDEECCRIFGAGLANDEGGVERFFTRWLRQPNFASLFKSEISKSKNLTVIVNASASDIRFDNENAKSVVALTPHGRRVTVESLSFIFACGTIENSRFFLSSRASSNVPWRDNQSIGRFFQDHLGGSVGTVQVDDEAKFRELFENGFSSGYKLQPKLRFSSQERRRSAIGVAGAFNFESDLTASFHNVKGLVRAARSGVAYSSFSSLPKDFWKIGKALIPIAIRYAKDKRVMALYDRAIRLHIQCEQMPIADSCIQLSRDGKKSDGLFEVDVSWKISGEEMPSIVRFCSSVDTYLTRNAIGRLIIDNDILEGDTSALDRLEDTYHQCGGTCMGRSARTGVVDGDCKVWNTKNVFIAGASVFPTSSHANCTLTALALAARLASNIISERI